MNLDLLIVYIYMSGWRDGLKHAEDRLQAWNEPLPAAAAAAATPRPHTASSHRLVLPD